VEEPYRKGVKAGDNRTNLGKGDSVASQGMRARDLREDTTQSAVLFKLTFRYLLLCDTLKATLQYPLVSGTQQVN